MKSSFVFFLKLVLLAGLLVGAHIAKPMVVTTWFVKTEPTFQVPIISTGPVLMRKDAYGKGWFGARRSGGRKHRGIDLVAPVGTPIVASKSGYALIGRKKNGLGLYIDMHHHDGSMTRYAHLDKILIEDGQHVLATEPIGELGKSGNAKNPNMQPHIHFEIWDPDGTPVDPLTVLSARIIRENHER